MKTLGIIGGVGPESTIEYYRTIIALYRARKPDGSYPQFIINSIDLKKEMEFVVRNDVAGLAFSIAVEIEKLACAGAEIALIASNTPHLAFEEIAAQSAIPLISIVETACAAAAASKLKKLALFGTRFTMQGVFYPKIFRENGSN
jgi:aspartate racemase